MNDYPIPIGLKHYHKDEPLLKAWLGLLLLVDTLKVIFGTTPKHEARHMRKESTWQLKAVEKIDALDMALDLSAFIISKLVSHFRRSLQETREELRPYVNRLSEKRKQLISLAMATILSLMIFARRKVWRR